MHAKGVSIHRQDSTYGNCTHGGHGPGVRRSSPPGPHVHGEWNPVGDLLVISVEAGATGVWVPNPAPPVATAAKVAAMAAPPGWREALLAEHGGDAALAEETYSLSESPAGPGGEATITLPGGRSGISTSARHTSRNMAQVPTACRHGR